MQMISFTPKNSAQDRVPTNRAAMLHFQLCKLEVRRDCGYCKAGNVCKTLYCIKVRKVACFKICDNWSNTKKCSCTQNPLNRTQCHVSKAKYSVLCPGGIQVLMLVICLFFVCEMRREDEGSFKMRSQYWERRERSKGRGTRTSKIACDTQTKFLYAITSPAPTLVCNLVNGEFIQDDRSLGFHQNIYLLFHPQ